MVLLNIRRKKDNANGNASANVNDDVNANGNGSVNKNVEDAGESVRFTSVKTDTVERAAERQGKLQIASFVWTIISTLYTVGAVIYFIANKWVSSKYNAVLIGLVVAWVIALIVILALAFSKHDAVNGNKALKIYRKALKIFKNLINILFLVITAVSMAGVVSGGVDDLTQWAMLAVMMLVAVIQLVLKIALIVIKIILRRRGKGNMVEVSTYVNGEKKENKTQTKLLRKFYHSEDD